MNLRAKHDVFLGYDWLEYHNPLLDFRAKSLAFTRCPPSCNMPTPPAESTLPLAEAIHGLHDFPSDAPEAEYIWVVQSISACIEQEAADKTQTTKIPEQYADFADVFEKTEFDKLPPHRAWDHEIVLKEEDRKLRGKVYPLSPKEWKALDSFIDENLATRHIRPSNSPIASPFFFVGKKDGGLRPTQDYRLSGRRYLRG